MNNDLYMLQENWTKLQKKLIEGTNFNDSVENTDQESPDVSLDTSIDEADKVTEPRKRMPLSQVYNLTGVVDENAAKKAIKDYIATNNVTEYDAMRNITEEIREFASATMNRCTKSLNLFRKVGAKKPSLDDHLNALDDQDIESKPFRK